MLQKTKKIFTLQSTFMLLLLGVTLSACNPEPEESARYTAVEETASAFIKGNEQLSSFYYIMQRIGYDRLLSAYGEYTIFVPTNESVSKHIDSLYHDKEAVIEHNGMTDCSLEGLSDSLCNEIVKYHIVYGIYNTIDIGAGGISLITLLKRKLHADGQTDYYGHVTINGKAVVVEPDNNVSNGVVHVINNVVPLNSKILPVEIERNKEFSIFNQALKLTGLSDSLQATQKNKTYTLTDNTDTSGNPLYYPEECAIMFTIFAEPDEVYHQKGIYTVDDLIEYANSIYANSEQWYDYVREKGIKVSTGNDYTNRFNALNMFVAYHILYAGMPEGELVFESKGARSINMWNYVNGGEPYDYYETMLPSTLLKIWQPQPGKKLYINRYQTFNTLTDELGTMGSNDMHQIIRQGVRICRNSENTWHYPSNIHTYNGYIHAINDILVYDAIVPKGVLHERIRFDSTTMLPEMINNNIRMATQSEIKNLNAGGNGDRVAFALDYFDGIVCYNALSCLRYNVKGAWRAYQADGIQGWGQYDLAIKIPPLPSGIYELRLPYSPMDHGGMMQFYIGNSNKMQSMKAMDIPLDVRIPADDPRIGWTVFYEEDDLGIASDAAMRLRGYMRAPFSYMGHPETNYGNETDENCRGDKTVSLRRILGRIQVKQSEELWLRIKNVISSNELKWQIDFVELIPTDVLDNDLYQEDWY